MCSGWAGSDAICCVMVHRIGLFSALGVVWNTKWKSGFLGGFGAVTFLIAFLADGAADMRCAETSLASQINREVCSNLGCVLSGK